MSALVWLRRDLRLHDHPALRAALDAGGPVTPVFCLDPGLLTGRHASGSRTQFMLECLSDLDDSLRERGSRLVIRRGPPQRELPLLARRLRATSVHFSSDVGPFARRREAQVTRALGEVGIELVAHPGLFVVDDLDSIRTGAGKPYTVFTPFARNWLGQPRRRVLGAPRALRAVAITSSHPTPLAPWLICGYPCPTPHIPGTLHPSHHMCVRRHNRRTEKI